MTDGKPRGRPAKHGASRTAAYRAWTSMRALCRNPNLPAYRYVGGRGITITPRWDDFEKFLEDMGDPPDRHKLARLDRDREYEPANCRWEPRYPHR